MPIYEYKCSKCQAQIEVVQKSSDQPPKKCGKCGGPLKKLASAPAIQFKGKGWYITDYAKKSGPETEGKPKGEAPKAETAPAPSAPAKESSAPKKED